MNEVFRDNTLICLRMTGNNGFCADEQWRESLTGSITCPHCRNIFSHVRNLDVVVSNQRQRRTDIDVLAPDVGNVRILSLRFLSIVGISQIEEIASIGAVIGSNGLIHKKHRSVIGLENRVVIRGEFQSTCGICRECGRLLCGAGGEQYVLRSEIPLHPIFVSDGQIFCTEKFWRKKIYGANLTRVEALEFPVRDKPEDGLPANNSALKRYLTRKRLFK